MEGIARHKMDMKLGETMAREGHNNLALKRQLITAKRRTDLQFDGNNMIGWFNLGRIWLV